MYKIKIILPVATDRYNESVYKEIKGFSLDPRFEFEVESLSHGPISIECEYDCAIASPHIINVAEQAETDGFHGVVVYCFDDPAVKACKEKLEIPVVGAGEAGVHYSTLLGKKFSVLMTIKNAITVTREMVENTVGPGHLASIRVVDIPVAKLDSSADKLFEALLASAKDAICQDHAEALVLGCTGMLGMAEKLQEEISSDIGAFIPVISPGATALHLVQSLVLLNYRHSGLTFMTPPDKIRK
ncbi:MAG: hydrogenase expression protein HupH [Firmicutes bacterium]|nr:hydrogenase expression protein HupH [Bacillota bacterium]